MESIKLLRIVKSNKKLQNRLNLDINDYKDYSQKYSSIEIELKPCFRGIGEFIGVYLQKIKNIIIFI